MTQFIDPLSQGSQLAIQRLHQQGEGRRQRASQQAIAGAGIRARSKDYSQLREMRERMQMKDLDARDRAAERVLAQKERVQEMRREYLQYYVGQDAKQLESIQALEKSLGDAQFNMLRADILSGRDREQQERMIPTLEQLHQEYTVTEERVGRGARSAFDRAITRFATAGKGFFKEGGSRAAFRKRHPDAVNQMAQTGDANVTRDIRSNYYLADGMANQLISFYEQDDELRLRFGPNSGKAKDALRDLYFGMLMSGPSGATDDNRGSAIPSAMQPYYQGAETWGAVVNKSLGVLQDDLGMPLQEIRSMIEEPARALQGRTNSQTYGSYLEFFGGDTKKAERNLARLFAGDADEEFLEDLEDAMGEFGFAQMFQRVANLPVLADALELPKPVSADELTDLITWLKETIREGGIPKDMRMAPGRFGQGALDYGEDMLGKLMENAPPDLGRGVAEDKIALMDQIRRISQQLAGLRESRDLLPTQALMESLE